MEAFTVAITAAQLMTSGLKMSVSISEVRERIRNAPRRFTLYAQQVELLVITAQRIKHNPNLHGPAVSSFLLTTLAETEAAQVVLDRFLGDSRKRRYFWIINGNGERTIIEHLTNLDRTVTAFSLYISTMTSMQVDELVRGVQQLHLNTDPVNNAGEVVVSSTILGRW
jgi:hypothetical protein